MEALHAVNVHEEHAGGIDQQSEMKIATRSVEPEGEGEDRQQSHGSDSHGARHQEQERCERLDRAQDQGVMTRRPGDVAPLCG